MSENTFEAARGAYAIPLYDAGYTTEIVAVEPVGTIRRWRVIWRVHDGDGDWFDWGHISSHPNEASANAKRDKVARWMADRIVSQRRVVQP
jgi:hypothetical protein